MVKFFNVLSNLIIKCRIVIGRKKDLKLVIHPTFFLVLIFFILYNKINIFFTYILSLLLHELSHNYMAKKCGYKMEKITLYPFGVSLCGEDDEFSFLDEIKIALAGPLCNFLLCAFSVCLWWIFPISFYYLSDFVFVNLVCCVFNLIPIFPLDGGRLLLAILSQIFERKKAVKLLKLMTFIFSIFVLLLFIISLSYEPNFSFAIMAILLCASAFNEDKKNTYLRILNMKFRNKKLKRGIFIKEFCLSEKCNLCDALKLISSNYILRLNIVNDCFKTKYVFSEQEILKCLQTHNSKTSFKEILETKNN